MERLAPPVTSSPPVGRGGAAWLNVQFFIPTHRSGEPLSFSGAGDLSVEETPFQVKGFRTHLPKYAALVS